MDSPYFFEGTVYWSEGDERAHFEWLDRVPCVRSVRGEGRRVFLDIGEHDLSAEDVRELLALYRRFGGDLSQLQHLNNGSGG